MVKYVKFLKNKQTEFLREVKLKHKKSWDNLAKLLDINRSMVFVYLNGKCKMPYERFKFLCSLYNIKETKYKTKIISIKNRPTNIQIPIFSSKFVEFIGILAGDGHLSKINYEISISGHKVLDRKYFNIHLNRLFKELFDIKPQIFVHKDVNYIKSRIYSKKLINHLSKTFGLPLGRKKGNLKIPKQINKSIYIKDYIRGLFDTDGSFHRHHMNTATIEIISADKEFLKQVYENLRYLKFTVGVSGKNLYLYKPDEIERFFNEIKPANDKHITKYKIYKQTGRVPLTRDMRG